MSLTRSQLRSLLKDFQFKDALIGLGWAHSSRVPFDEVVGDATYRVIPIAEQGGIPALMVHVANDNVPNTTECRALDKKLEASFNRNILIFVNADNSQAYIQAAGLIEHKGKTKRVPRGAPYQKGRPLEPLVAIFDSLQIPYDLLDESGQADHTRVAEQIQASGLFAEKVTKKFFRDFSTHRKAFVEFLSWIEDEAKRDWYCSVILNRLMFIYFIADKGFLPGGRGFLRRQLLENQKENGQDTFYTHYLLPVSFFGLGAKPGERGQFEKLFKDILYLDGGLFAMHEVEKDLGLLPEAIQAGSLPEQVIIPDREFEKWFDYFDDWRWTLDEENANNEGTISPHILGYIFEKYINQKQMGAYYTKEDITGYICRNTIIPRLFDMLADTGKNGEQAVHPLPIGPHPNLLNDGLGISRGEGIDRYIHDAVKSTEFLPTETDYEYDHRQKRYQSILQDYDDGKIARIDDFITYNLDIVKLAKDFVDCIQDAEVLHDFYFKCLQQVTVLDPACGSGAFLFAALNILEPLYEAAFAKMTQLVRVSGASVPDRAEDSVRTWKGEFAFANELDEQQTFVDIDVATATTNVLAEFRSELERMALHPDLDYFITKTIIVNNLYGVDIMEEAVEICKLRLFLALIAMVEPDASKENRGVEPLPDIDFNILAGNTLVGYTSTADINLSWGLVEGGTLSKSGAMPFEKDHSRLQDLCREYGQLLAAYRLNQLGQWKGVRVSKNEVLAAADQVRPELDEDAWRLIRTEGKVRTSMTLAQYKKSHQPFHWLLKFPLTSWQGGFDCIVGNPPWKDLRTGSLSYSWSDRSYTVSRCGNLYALMLERCPAICLPKGRIGMIVPVSSISTEGFESLQVVLKRARYLWVSCFDDRPAKLFDGLEHVRASIILMSAPRNCTGIVATTHYQKWLSDERPHLFDRLQYLEVTPYIRDGSLPKVSDPREISLLSKLAGEGKTGAAYYTARTSHKLMFARKSGYFLNVFDFTPEVRDPQGDLRQPTELKDLYFDSASHAQLWLSVLNSNLFYWYFTVHSDCRHLNKRELEWFPFNIESVTVPLQGELVSSGRAIMERLKVTSIVRPMTSPTGRITVQCIYPRSAKPLIDTLDEALAKHYGFTDEELEFIINYDIKYRMGQGSDDRENESA